MSVGERLKSVREEQGISIDEIAARTYIRASHIAALEKGEHHLLPPSRLRYFVRDYARVLGLDPDPLLADLPDDAATPPPPPTPRPSDPPPSGLRRPSEKKEKVASGAEEKGEKGRKRENGTKRGAGAAAISAVERLRRKAPRYSPIDQGNPMLARGMIGIALLLILGIGVWYLFFSDDDDPTEQLTLVSDTAADSPIRIIGDEGESEEGDTTGAEALPAGDSLVLRGVFTARAWYSIAMDGDREDQGTLDSGEVREWRATEFFSISLGNAGGVRFSINGKDVGTLGPRGGTVRGRMINADGLQGGPTTTPSERRRSRPQRRRTTSSEEPNRPVPELTPSEPRVE